MVFFLYNKFQLYCLKIIDLSAKQFYAYFLFLRVVAYSIKHSFLYVVCCSVKVRKQSFKIYILKVFTMCVCMAKKRYLYHFILYHDFILVSMISSLPNTVVEVYASKSVL